jgi:anti-sigma B factor antagonist
MSTLDLANVTLSEHDRVIVASITGEVDISNADTVGRALTELPNVALGLVVDLRGVAYMDSTGISLLHELASRLRQRSQRLMVVCPPGAPPRRVLDLTALNAHTPVLDELEPAIQALRDG